MHRFALCLVLAACSGGDGDSLPGDATTGHPDASIDTAVDAGADAPAGFGDLSGMCGVLQIADLTGATPELFHDTFTFAREYMDPADRPLLTPGGQHMAATPNAGGSSGLSEIFAYEELARCEHATFLKSETEIVYDGTGKITDLEVEIAGHKIGVSVTRGFAFPLGDPYPLAQAETLINRKLTDIQASTAHVSAADKWDKQILAVLAWDATDAATVEQAWQAADAATKGNTIVIVTATDGADQFIYTNQ